MLEPVGVTGRDETVYRALLARQEASPAELAEELGDSTESVGRSLVRLRERGLATRLSGHRRRFAATEPEAAIEALVRTRAGELDAVRHAAVELAEAFRAASRATGEIGAVELVSGRRALGEWFVRLQHVVKTEMLVLDRPPYALAASNPVEPVSLAQGVRWRAIYTPEALELTGAMAELARLRELGEEARVLPDFPLKLAIADRQLAVLPLDLDLGTAQVAVVRPSTLLDALVDVFESYWRAATPLDPDSTTSADPTLTADDASLLTLLVTGLKDDAIARQLGWSPRTMRRRIRRLYDLLGAGNRFQAGVEAARRGWL